MSQSPRPKIFCIGFQKTGTSSMRDALTQYGFKVAGHYGTDLEFEDIRARYVEMGLALAEKYDVVQDMPWPLIFRELDAAFPGAKFIFTKRDTDNWYQSMVKHFGTKPGTVRQLTYGEDYAFPEGNEERYKQVYDAHTADVMAYFADRPNDFAVFDLENGDGWAKLGAFLELDDVPEGPFVHSNKAEMRSSAPYRLRLFGLRIRLWARRLLGLNPSG